MSKLKTNSGAKKRFRFTKSGKVKIAPARKRHNLSKRSQKMKRTARGMEVTCLSNANIIRKLMPYNRIH